MKIIVAGASGFIGSKICLKAIENGHEVIALTNETSISSIKSSQIKKIKFDLLNDQDQIPKYDGIDCIVNAATANDKVSKNIVNGIDLSLKGTIKLLEYATKNDINSFIFFSTAQVYGSDLNGEVKEDNTIELNNSYSLNHYLGEELCRFYSDNKKINIVCARPSNVFGVPEINLLSRAYLVPMCFVKEALFFNKITLRSSGKQVRNFVSTDSIADQTIRLIKSFPFGFNLINMGSKYNASILEIANLVKKIGMQKHNLNIDLNIESDYPLESNNFKYLSNYQNSFEERETTLKKMEEIIINLFKKFK